MIRRLILLVMALGAPVFAARYGGSQNDEAPLPALDDFLQQVRVHLRSDQSLLSQYTYTARETIRNLDRKGNVKSVRETVYEVYPSPETGLTYRRMIARDGSPTDPRELEKMDRQQDEKLRKHAKKLEEEGVDRRKRREARKAEEQREEDAAIDEMFRLYGITMNGREWLEAHAAIVLSFHPRPGFKPATDAGKFLVKMAGRAWFSERDHELMRVQLNVIDNISIGWGLLARLNKGATGVLQRRKINDEIWMPAEAHFTGSARLLLLKGMNVDFSSEYSDFKKFTVETRARFRNLPAP